MLVNGLGGAVPPKARARLLKMAPEEAVERLRNVASVNPQFAQQLAAQLGRMQASQQEAAP
jgi:DNA-binding TFAR19-related protein (PDSD5 family)